MLAPASGTNTAITKPFDWQTCPATEKRSSLVVSKTTVWLFYKFCKVMAAFIVVGFHFATKETAAINVLCAGKWIQFRSITMLGQDF